MLLIRLLPLSWTLLFSLTCLAQSNEGSLANMSLDELLGQRSALHSDSVTSSATVESVRDAPGALVIVDANAIKRRGYDSLDELVADLPGFDTIVTNGTLQVVAYQRGYRTPWTQRTLVLINGRVDNHLWNHAAQLSRQYPMHLIDRVEVLYGPTGAVYGPNAFLGVINIITRQGKQLEGGTSQMTASVGLASYNTQTLDMAWVGNRAGLTFSLGARLFSSDEAPIDDYSRWGYTDPSWLSDPSVWGNGIGQGTDPATGNPSPLGDVNVDGRLDTAEQINNKPLGSYQDPSENTGLYGELGLGNWQLGASYWLTDEGYGPYYSFADAQPNAHWIHESRQFFARHQGQWGANLNSRTDLVYRENRVGGDWIESLDGAVSLSEWNSFNSAWRFEQLLSLNVSAPLTLTGGLKLERKNLTRLYMACNYYDSLGVCPAQAATAGNGIGSDGSGVTQADTISSLNPSTLPPGLAKRSIPANNRATTDDVGLFGQAVYQRGRWRFNAGLRWDHNSEYGREINPRLAAIYHLHANTTLKLVYGEAFQEPSPKELYGGFSGRAANSTLKPEKARNLEFIAIHQGRLAMHEVSLFHARYHNAIAGAENVGDRRIQGFEYRANFRWNNPFDKLGPITTQVFYTLTDARAQQQYNSVSQAWVNDWGLQGDVAPHKITAILNLPLPSGWNLNLRGHWSAARTLFSENPLRAQGVKAEAYTRLDAHLLYQLGRWRLGLKGENLLASDYLAPGVEAAASGNNFNQDADGFQNSLIPQVNTPVYSLNVAVDF